jgi:DNA-binding NtrC family response regulator
MTPQTPLNILLIVPRANDADAHPIAAALNADGHAVSRACSISEARDLCESGRFDLVITADPLPDGRATDLRAATTLPCARLPAILVTKPSPADGSATPATFAATLHHPVAPTALRDAVRRAATR